ncbi:GTPase-activating protein S13 [Coniosporium uncinatum]|uniref:GTPase-activating protein S13 n=1 Tax=Coniosporium uncinatum TaxID=93489 RepID=A0ACC3DWZ9_9PEZI|nr:GTPase-activating protein S13 [Coniosporium uncinatum]
MVMYSPETKSYNRIASLSGHTDWVRDVSWSPTILSKTYIASASQDKSVRIWSSSDPSGQKWEESAKLDFPEVAWRCSWSLSGNVLAVSTGDNRVSLYKQKLTGKWELMKTIEE